MNEYTFVADPGNIVVRVVATSEKEAYKKAFKQLDEYVQDNCSGLDCIDIKSVRA